MATWSEYKQHVRERNDEMGKDIDDMIFDSADTVPSER